MDAGQQAAGGTGAVGTVTGVLACEVNQSLLKSTLTDVGFEPFGERVLVRADAPAAAPRDGIVVPGSGDEAPLTGTVLALGSGFWREIPGGRGYLQKPAEPSLNLGQRVAFGKYAGVEITVRGQKLLVMKLEEVLGAFTG